MVDLIVSSRSSVQTPEHILQPGGVALRDFVSPLRMHKRKSEAVEYYSEVASEAVKSRASADDLAKTRSFVITVECASVSQLTENIRGRTLSQSFYDLGEKMTRLVAVQTRRSETMREGWDQLTETLTRIAKEPTRSIRKLNKRITRLIDVKTRQYNERGLRFDALDVTLNNLVDGQTRMRDQLNVMNRRLDNLVDGQTQMR